MAQGMSRLKLMVVWLTVGQRSMSAFLDLKAAALSTATGQIRSPSMETSLRCISSLCSNARYSVQPVGRELLRKSTLGPAYSSWPTAA
jgi:hypothetical protein